MPAEALRLSPDEVEEDEVSVAVDEADAITEDAIEDAAAGETEATASNTEGETASKVSLDGAEQSARVSPQHDQELAKLLYTTFCME